MERGPHWVQRDPSRDTGAMSWSRESGGQEASRVEVQRGENGEIWRPELGLQLGRGRRGQGKEIQGHEGVAGWVRGGKGGLRVVPRGLAR